MRLSELSAWHKFRRVNFVKTDRTVSPPECFPAKTLLDLVFQPKHIETLCGTKVNLEIVRSLEFGVRDIGIFKFIAIGSRIFFRIIKKSVYHQEYFHSAIS